MESWEKPLFIWFQLEYIVEKRRPNKDEWRDKSGESIPI